MFTQMLKLIHHSRIINHDEMKEFRRRNWFIHMIREGRAGQGVLGDLLINTLLWLHFSFPSSYSRPGAMVEWDTVTPTLSVCYQRSPACHASQTICGELVPVKQEESDDWGVEPLHQHDEWSSGECIVKMFERSSYTCLRLVMSILWNIVTRLHCWCRASFSSRNMSSTCSL